MKPAILHLEPGATGENGTPTDLSAEAALRREVAKLGQWLIAHGIDLETEPRDLHADSRDRLYLRFGLFVGLQQALDLLTSRGETVH